MRYGLNVDVVCQNTSQGTSIYDECAPSYLYVFFGMCLVSVETDLWFTTFESETEPDLTIDLPQRDGVYEDR